MLHFSCIEMVKVIKKNLTKIYENGFIIIITIIIIIIMLLHFCYFVINFIFINFIFMII